MPKGKSKNIGVEMAAMPEPRMYIDLRDGDVNMVQEMKIGENVRVLITGKVASLNQRMSSEGKTTHKSGSFALEKFDIELLSEGDYADLSRDD